KRSIVIDGATETGRAQLTELAKTVDAIVVGLDADRTALLQANPRCVVALVSDFGEDGPFSHWRGSGMVFHALSRVMHVHQTARPGANRCMASVIAPSMRQASVSTSPCSRRSMPARRSAGARRSRWMWR